MSFTSLLPSAQEFTVIDNSAKTHIVCYSGGEQSGMVAVEVFRRYGNKNLVLLNSYYETGRCSGNRTLFGYKVLA